MTMLDKFDFEYQPPVIDTDPIMIRCEIHYDECSGAPWEENDGHGLVSGWERRAKRPGELVLNDDGRGNKRFYDWQESVKIARRDGWCCWRNGEELNEAVRRDYEYLRAWCNDEWYYVGVVVFPLTVDGDELRSKSQSIWGIGSTDTDYIKDTAQELAREISL